MKMISFLGAAAALALTGPAFAGNLLINGSFESGIGSGSGWTVTHSVGTAPVAIAYGTNAGYPNGAFGEAIGFNGVTSVSPDAVGKSLLYFSADNNGIFAPDVVRQTINVIAGKTYAIGLDYYAPFNGLNNPADAAFGLAINNSIIGAALVKWVPGGTWNNFATTWQASTTGSVSFDILFSGLGRSSSNYAADIAIDRAYVNAPVPEPATWAMMISGLGLVGASMRRRKATVRFA